MSEAIKHTFWWTQLIQYIIKMVATTTTDTEHMVMPQYGIPYKVKHYIPPLLINQKNYK